MYRREEISKLKQSFWTSFGKYMQPVLSADGLPVNWINYKTGINGISFKMDAARDHAVIMIRLTNNNAAIQQAHYDQLLQLKPMLQQTLGEEDWVWEQAIDEYGNHFSAISKTLNGVNVLDQSQWPAIISFLKPRIIALDEFWTMAKQAFE